MLYSNGEFRIGTVMSFIGETMELQL